jgi:hypothetical protein
LRQKREILYMFVFNSQLFNIIGKTIHNTPNNFWEMEIKYKKFAHHKRRPHAGIDGISSLNYTTSPRLTMTAPYAN